MASVWTTLHEGLAANSRLGSLAPTAATIGLREHLALAVFGVVAAVLVACLDLNMKVPGHSILFPVLPFAFGLALVPRRSAGLLLGAHALSGALLIEWLRLGHAGPGALTSLGLLGPCLELALWSPWLRARPAAVFMVAGLACNLIAFAARFGFKVTGLDGGRLTHFATWWPRALVSYPLCGIIAGALAGAIAFHVSAPAAEAGKDPS